MQFEMLVAKNGEPTLKINNKFIYSNYSPIKEAERFIASEFENNYTGYILIGLGLGYHLDALLNLTNKNVVVLPINNEDLIFYKNNSVNNRLSDIFLLNSSLTIDISNFQIIIPSSILNAIDDQHELYYYLQDIKILQRSFKSQSELMEINYNKNIKLNDSDHSQFKSLFQGKSACLISAGPSLDNLINQVKFAQTQGLYILSVGSALKTLLYNGIQPSAVIITDAQEGIINQFNETKYEGILFYLCTANNKTVENHLGNRIILYQKGYELSEKMMSDDNLLETGGSVATIAFSLLEYMGFDSVYLFGQDLGFAGEMTHANNSTSTKRLLNKSYKQIEANNGTFINTEDNFYSYLRWFEKKFSNTMINVYNTAKLGAKIRGATFVDSDDLEDLILKSSCI